MEQEYSDVTSRMQQEREGKGLSQERVGRELGISQSFLSRVEQGNNYLYYNQIKMYKSLEMDTHFIFTGNRVDLTEIQNMLNTIRPSDYYYLAQLFYINLERLCKIRNDALHCQILRQIQYSKYILLNGLTSQTICLLLRHYCGYNQEKMAKYMRIGRTNYRSIEQKTENFHSLSFLFILDLFFRHYCRSIRSRMSKIPSRSLNRGNRCTFCRSSWLL